MVKFTHYLVTRFNVRISGKGPEHIISDQRGADWIHERMSLFADFCAASINGQTNTNFTWLLYIDVQTPDPILQQIKNAIASTIKYLLIPVENFDALLSDLRSRCASVPTPFVITTRLDNDDAVSKTFIEIIHQHFQADNDHIINLLGGVNYNIRKQILTRKRHLLRNSFCSIIEKRKDAGMTTVMGFDHLHPPQNVISKNLPVAFAFWINLHGHNAAMRHISGPPWTSKEFIHHYSIDPRLLKISIANTIAYTLRWFPNAFKRKMVFKLKALLGKPEQVSSLKNNHQ